MDNWLDSLPDEIKANPTLSKFKTPDDLASSYVELERKIGRSLTIPGDDATDDAWERYYAKAQESGHLALHPDHADDDHSSAFWKSVGVPEDVDGYKLPEDFKELPDDYVSNMRKVAKEAGWTNKQFQATLQEFGKEYGEQQEALDQSIEEDKAVIAGKWGMAEEQKKSAVNALISKYADPDHPLSELNSAAYLLLDNIVQAFSGKGPQGHAQPSAGGDTYTPGELKEMIADITTKQIEETHTIGREKYKALMAKKHRLQEMLSKSLK